MDNKTIKKLIGQGNTPEDTIALRRINKAKERDIKRIKRDSLIGPNGPLTNKLLMIYAYSKGTPIKELAETYHFDTKSIPGTVNDLLEDILNIKETSLLEANKNNKSNNTPINIALRKLKDYEAINSSFLSLLSPDDSSTLTEEESLFSYLFVYRGDSKEALISSGLNEGLLDTKSSSYSKAITLRSVYLKEKPNVASYIQKLREERYIDASFDKTSIQNLLMEELQVMKERGDKRDRTNIRQTIELLGKTIGAFTERVEIHEVDPSTSLDLLIGMAKEAETKELT